MKAKLMGCAVGFALSMLTCGLLDISVGNQIGWATNTLCSTVGLIGALLFVKGDCL